MKARFVVLQDRVPVIADKIGSSKVQIVRSWEENPRYVVLELTLVDGLDVLGILHAGIHIGMEILRQPA